MTTKKLNIGVFGGGRGSVMIDVLFAHPDARLAAVCDKYEPLLEKVRRKAAERGMEVACYNNFEDFLAHPDLDAVVLANYATEHATFAIRCLKAGKHVLSEVLPSETVAQAVELIETVEQTGKVYAYAENYCYMYHSFEMRKKYAEGVIGEAKYAEGNYYHDCSDAWIDLTYGERDHWRNRLHPTFYCTHSLGPLMTITGLRPKSVVGFEILPPDSLLAQGRRCGAGMEMVTMENGALFKSVHGPLKRQGITQFYVYGNKGAMESGQRSDGQKRMNICRETEELCRFEWERYDPENDIAVDIRDASGVETHGGSDFYPTHCFIQKILGREDGKWCIDVYQAVDMSLCGLFAFRSILAGNTSMKIPNLCNGEERDLWRNDHACTNPDIAGDQLLPTSSYPALAKGLSDEEYAAIKQVWREKHKHDGESE